MVLRKNLPAWRGRETKDSAQGESLKPTLTWQLRASPGLLVQPKKGKSFLLFRLIQRASSRVDPSLSGVLLRIVVTLQDFAR